MQFQCYGNDLCGFIRYVLICRIGHLLICFSERLLAAPTRWSHVVTNLTSLGDRQWVTADVLNYYLLVRWWELRQTAEVYYVDYDFVHKYTAVNDAEILDFKKRYTNAQFTKRQVIFIVHHSDHWFTVVFDYECNFAWVLGRNINPDESQSEGEVQEWKGALIWQNVARLLQWNDVSEYPEHVINVDWVQVSPALSCIHPP